MLQLLSVRVTINFFRQPQMRHLSWFLAGDFNRSPDRLENDLMTEHLERVVAVLAPTEPTQIGGGILDYGVIVDRAPYSQRVEALRNPQLASDHYPVAFLARSC